MSNHLETEQRSLVLAVEDNVGDARLIREGVESVDAAVDLDVLKSGTAALERVSAADDGGHGENEGDPEVPALVLLDLNLPGASGFEILDVLRDSEQFKHVPVVVVSSSENAEDVTRAYEAAANAYVTKPTDPDEYIELVATAIDLWITGFQSPDND